MRATGGAPGSKRLLQVGGRSRYPRSDAGGESPRTALASRAGLPTGDPPGGGLDELLEDLLGRFARHDRVDCRQEVQPRQPEELARHEFTPSDGREDLLGEPGRERTGRLVECTLHGLRECTRDVLRNRQSPDEACLDVEDHQATTTDSPTTRMDSEMSRLMTIQVMEGIGFRLRPAAGTGQPTARKPSRGERPAVRGPAPGRSRSASTDVAHPSGGGTCLDARNVFRSEAGTRGSRVLIIRLSPPAGGARADQVLLVGGDDHGSCA